MTDTLPSTYRINDRDLLLDAPTNNYVLRVKDLPDADKPREKLTELGPHDLTVAELLAVIWGVGSKKEDVLAMAQRTLKEYGEYAIGNERNPHHLAAATDIPLSKATQVVAAFELGRRYHATSAGRPLHIRNAKQAHAHLKAMGHMQKEQLRAVS